MSQGQDPKYLPALRVCTTDRLSMTHCARSPRRARYAQEFPSNISSAPPSTAPGEQFETYRHTRTLAHLASPGYHSVTYRMSRRPKNSCDKMRDCGLSVICRRIYLTRGQLACLKVNGNRMSSSVITAWRSGLFGTERYVLGAVRARQNIPYATK